MQWQEQYNQVSMHGYEAWGLTTCAGSSFIIRADTLVSMGGMPTWCVDEGHSLGFELKRKGFLSHFHAEPLTLGTLPHSLSHADRCRFTVEEIRVWAKCAAQAFFFGCDKLVGFS